MSIAVLREATGVWQPRLCALRAPWSLPPSQFESMADEEEEAEADAFTQQVLAEIGVEVAAQVRGWHSRSRPCVLWASDSLRLPCPLCTTTQMVSAPRTSVRAGTREAADVADEVSDQDVERMLASLR